MESLETEYGIHLLKLDDKGRITVPVELGCRTGDTLFASVHTHYLVISKTRIRVHGVTQSIGIIRQKVDGSRRFLIGIPTLISMGFNELDIDELKKSDKKTSIDSTKNTESDVAKFSIRDILWTPRETNEGVDFLLFFGKQGQNVWNKMRDTKGALLQAFNP